MITIKPLEIFGLEMEGKGPYGTRWKWEQLRTGQGNYQKISDVVVTDWTSHGQEAIAVLLHNLWITI